MASLKDALVDLKGILDNALPRAIVLRPGTVVEEIDTYGDRWLRRLQIQCEVNVHYEVADAAASAQRLLDALEDFDTILINKFHLGKTVDDYQAAKITAISQSKLVIRAESSFEWFGAIITVMVDIVKQASATAQ